MTSEEMHAAFEKHEDEFLKFDRIPEAERRHQRPDLCAMLLMAERFPSTGDIVSSASHDEIWFAARPEEYDGDWALTEADVVYLSRCGIKWDEESDSLSSFV